jgi:hypothetical protein
MTLKNPPGSVPNIGRIIAQARELKNPWPIFDAYSFSSFLPSDKENKGIKKCLFIRLSK